MGCYNSGMTTTTQKEMILQLLRNKETFSSAAEIMNKNHLASGQRPYTRNAIAGVAFRAGYRKTKKEDAPLRSIGKPATPAWGNKRPTRPVIVKARPEASIVTTDAPVVAETPAPPALETTRETSTPLDAVNAPTPLTGAPRKPLEQATPARETIADAMNKSTTAPKIDRPAKPSTIEQATVRPEIAAAGKPAAQTDRARKGGTGNPVRRPATPEIVIAARKVEIREPGPKNIEELSPCDCRWPSRSEPASDRTSRFFCESPAVEGKPYCARHLKIAHDRNSEKLAPVA